MEKFKEVLAKELVDYYKSIDYERERGVKEISIIVYKVKNEQQCKEIHKMIEKRMMPDSIMLRVLEMNQ